MNNKFLTKTVCLVLSFILTTSLLTGCDMSDRDHSFPHKIVFDRNGGEKVVDLNFLYFATCNTGQAEEEKFVIFDYDTVYQASWLRVCVSSDRRTTFTASPNTTGERRQILLNRLGPDNTDVEIVQK